MATKKRIKVRYVEVNVKSGNFVSKLIGEKTPHDFSDIKLLRNLLSNEKSRILYVLKSKNPRSIYELAKILGRDFKSVREDIKVLERFGFIEFHAEKTGNRESLKPVLVIDSLQIQIEI
ncbi:MAG: HTH domain-containing protein [Nanoarchaeota archaeon]|nr:HTH domain-containing protein [Nanoarchaeota archaeon]